MHADDRFDSVRSKALTIPIVRGRTQARLFPLPFRGPENIKHADYSRARTQARGLESIKHSDYIRVSLQTSNKTYQLHPCGLAIKHSSTHCPCVDRELSTNMALPVGFKAYGTVEYPCGAFELNMWTIYFQELNLSKGMASEGNQVPPLPWD